MEGHKHFSHNHSLHHHLVPHGTQTTCSGCKLTATGTLFACLPCNFYLHENCYRATRSFKHPSHLSHPLTLAPYPTYPSNSFYCDSCRQIGTGFSYSCSHCEFDIHIQCAYNNLSHQNISSQNQTPNSIYLQPMPNQFLTPQQAVTHHPIQRDADDLANQLAATQIRIKIAAMGQQNALELLDPPGTIYKYHDSNDLI